MNISREDLRKLIKEIVLQLEQDKAKEQFKDNKKQTMAIVFPRKWDKKYYRLLAFINRQNSVHLVAVVSDEIDDKYLQLLEMEGVFDEFITLSEYEKNTCVADMVLFAVFPRNNCIRLCLGLTEDKIDLIVKRQWEKGKQISIFKGGLDELTGLEPAHYRSKIEKYYKELESYGIITS